MIIIMLRDSVLRLQGHLLYFNTPETEIKLEKIQKSIYFLLLLTLEPVETRMRQTESLI